ncbi:MAG TPA: hypothetical protein EYQ24_12780 [Bacteroidetes bacterium]|nr:hypothetical protein [Bacteroidota bacterium]
MLNLPIPRRSILDSRLRSQSHETRRLGAGYRVGDTHLGHGSRTVTPPARTRYRTRPARTL